MISTTAYASIQGYSIKIGQIAFQTPASKAGKRGRIHLVLINQN
jgi:hypothetical protein